MDSINEAFENGVLIFFASNPLEDGDNRDHLRNWHLKNQDIFNSHPNWRFFVNAKMIQDEFPKVYSELMASIGAVLPQWSGEQLIDGGMTNESCKRPFQQMSIRRF